MNSPVSLVRYGRTGFVGRFTSDTPFDRGDRVVVRGPRGTELGEVLTPLDGGFTAPADGSILRVLTPADIASADHLDTAARWLLVAARDGTAAHGLPLEFVDVETTLDSTAILHALPWEACDATPLLDDLTARSGLTVRLLDLTRLHSGEKPETSHGGCGKPGCGTQSAGGCSTCGTGGCGTNSCSRGAVASAGELTAYFAALRQQMETPRTNRTPIPVVQPETGHQ